MPQLFVYGTLREKTVQKRILGRPVDGAPDKLLGYSRDEVLIGTKYYPTLEKKAKGVVDGLVLELSDEELAKADKYEGNDFSRFQATLASGKSVWVYGRPEAKKK